MKLRQYWNGTLRETEGSPGETVYDLIVVGLGTAGAVAAITAARLGLRVLGLELLPAMGGQGTLGYVMPYYFGGSGGLYEELDRKTREQTAMGFAETNGLHPDCKLFVLEREAGKAGAELCFDARVTGVWLEGKTVKGVQWLREGRLLSAGAWVVLDCTGEAEVCALSGCAVRRGRESDGSCQPFSLPMTTYYQGKLCSQFVDSGFLEDDSPEACSRALTETMTGPMYLRDPFDPIDRVIAYSPRLGIREGRRIVGETTLRLKDCLDEKIPGTPLFYACANLDKHGSDYAMESLEMQEWCHIGRLWGIRLAIPVPLGCLIPKGYDGLLAAGRHLAVDHDVASAVRMKRDMQKCGEAAAFAAAAAISRNCPLREVDAAWIRPQLEESGCLDPHPVFMKRMVSRKDEENPALEWLTDPADIREGLLSEEPGLALFSARRLGKRGAALLREWMGEELLRKPCALGLGIMGLPEALPELRRMAFSPEEDFWSASSALCLLRRVGEAEDLPALEALSVRDELLRPYVRSAADSILSRISCEKNGGLL